MSIQRYDCGPANELDEVEDGNYVNYWDHLNKMGDTFAAKMRLAQQVDDHKAALAEKEAELEKARELIEALLEELPSIDKVINLGICGDIRAEAQLYLGGES